VRPKGCPPRMRRVATAVPLRSGSGVSRGSVSELLLKRGPLVGAQPAYATRFRYA